MHKIQTEILVIGGGATGTGILRDLAMRGFRCVLVEKRDLSHGTTGRYHGLLHSGGRYVVKDPQAAKECIRENRILRKIMPQCIEDTGGFFVLTPWDDPGYAPRFEAGCAAAGIPCEPVPISKMLQIEPRLNPRISHCYRVPDASADSFMACDLNAAAARALEAQVLRYHEVHRLLLDAPSASVSGQEQSKPLGRVVGALCRDLVTGEDVTILADLVVSAAGAWAGLIAQSIGLKIHVVPGKGTMLAMNHRIVNTVINRCKMPADGDILVPAHTVSVIGTTDVPVSNPDQFAIDPWEVKLCLDEGDKMVPGFKNMRMLRAWAGVRPLYQETRVGDTRDITRAYVLLDHAERDGVEGFITITSGKWTTYRLMAEHTVDLVCKKLAVDRICRTADEPLYAEPGSGHYHTLGSRLAKIETQGYYSALICECELATVADVQNAIEANQAKTIDDIRRDVRLGMGPCQGGFCTYRVAGMLHQMSGNAAESTNLALREFLQERWKGLLPVLWGQQLRQECLDELIYLSILNVDHLPGPFHSPLSSENYAPPDWENQFDRSTLFIPPPEPELPISRQPHQADTLIIGAGLGGLTAAWAAAQTGNRVRVIAKGWGATHWDTGCIDMLGYYPLNNPNSVESPRAALTQLFIDQPDHPYAITGLQAIEEALAAFQEICSAAGYPYAGSLDKNWLLPSAAGAMRPTCLAPDTMLAGDLRRSDPMLIVGFIGYHDFYPQLIAANLTAQGIPAHGLQLTLPQIEQSRTVTTVSLARLFADPVFRTAVADQIKPHIGAAQRIGFPAVLGLSASTSIQQELQERLGKPVFEIPTLPPSVPGIRLHTLLLNTLNLAGVRVLDGLEAVSAQRAGQELMAILTESAARRQSQPARTFILATGGLLGGGLQTNYEGWIREVVFNLPVLGPSARADWYRRDFLASEGHPIYQAGPRVNRSFQPLDDHSQPLYPNLFLAGNILGSCDPIRERSRSGIALIGGFAAGRAVAERLRGIQVTS